MDSTGYDGAFLIEKNKWYQIFLSETKSSNIQYDSSRTNYLNYKINESLNDLSKKFSGNISSARKQDNSTIMDFIMFSKSDTYDISDEDKEKLRSQWNESLKICKIPNAIASTMSRNNPSGGNFNILKKRDFHFITTSVLLENSKEVIEIGRKLLTKMVELYG